GGVTTSNAALERATAWPPRTRVKTSLVAPCGMVTTMRVSAPFTIGSGRPFMNGASPGMKEPKISTRVPGGPLVGTNDEIAAGANTRKAPCERASPLEPRTTKGAVSMAPGGITTSSDVGVREVTLHGKRPKKTCASGGKLTPSMRTAVPGGPASGPKPEIDGTGRATLKRRRLTDWPPARETVKLSDCAPGGITTTIRLGPSSSDGMG